MKPGSRISERPSGGKSLCSQGLGLQRESFGFVCIWLPRANRNRKQKPSIQTDRGERPFSTGSQVPGAAFQKLGCDRRTPTRALIDRHHLTRMFVYCLYLPLGRECSLVGSTQQKWREQAHSTQHHLKGHNRGSAPCPWPSN